MSRFDRMNAQVLGISVDSVPSLKAWSDSLGGITYPLLSDFYPHGKIAETFGVLRPDGKSERAIFVLDKLGIIRYVDVHDIDDLPDNEVLFRVLSEIEGRPVPPPVPKVDTPTKLQPVEATTGWQFRPDVDVVIYCTSWCPACRRARIYMQEHDIQYLEIDINKDREAAARVRSYANGSETTPTFDVRGTIVVNFNRTRLNELLGIQE